MSHGMTGEARRGTRGEDSGKSVKAVKKTRVTTSVKGRYVYEATPTGRRNEETRRGVAQMSRQRKV